MSEQDNGQVSTLQRPTTDDPKAWKAYWEAQSQPWRTEPEIDGERQKFLAERRAILPDIEQGIYPFKDIKLSRSDVEWLLATHENGRGPVDWSDETQQERQGLDLRGAILQSANLRRLPLTGMLGGLDQLGTQGQNEMAAAHMENVSLDEAHLERAFFLYAHMEGARLIGASLQGADLTCAHLEEATLHHARLENANFYVAHLKRAGLIGAYMEGADLRVANLEGAFLANAHLERACLLSAHLERSDLSEAHLERAILKQAYLDDAFLHDIILSERTRIGPSLVDIRWGNANLAVVKWSQIKLLDEEYQARQKMQDGKVKASSILLREYEEAVRANRQLALVLQSQGLNEDAARFAYRAQRLQRIVLRRQKKFGQYLFSLFLDLLAGHGYHPLRTLFWYLLTICTFALAYHYAWATFHLEKITHHPLSYVGAFVFSVTAFHGRGFFLGGDFGYDSLITILAAAEAVIGLVIEFSFIATFTQRFFGR